MSFLCKEQICVIDHSVYSSDLLPFDFYDDIRAIQVAVTQILKNLPLDDIKKLMHKLYINVINIVLS